jgi:hypothetical protein
MDVGPKQQPPRAAPICAVEIAGDADDGEEVRVFFARTSSAADD